MEIARESKNLSSASPPSKKPFLIKGKKENKQSSNDEMSMSDNVQLDDIQMSLNQT